ncbi:MAG: FadR family transcriptional regulator [Confluentimicrobium sp.]|uniref:DNA-binding FadR family transcriptional regulator n=1 Tax=Actibacterium naphthalenivorans TaxID=1614693 RepID=A0A840CCG5_9RHOB|nr:MULTISPECIES: GntR family transcriptional regulator [Actibacterium]MBB4020516.1 DNA-binding FadR family transcriptional regulator [Actibacterium naphthalenivorans]MBC55746.1 FadR family transcriptional regulator [Actibacterium sp.]MDY6860815.1 GntR family transcriptional regulator [Pseudomonadota bacterium]
MPVKEEDNLDVAFKPVQSHRTFELVCERVREKLLRGELTPGDKLPPERDLAAQLGVSRNVVREALRSLEIAGVVALRKGVKGGAFIQEGAASRITQALSDLITLNAISLKDLFEARIMILEMVIDHAFKDGVQPDFSGLEAVIEDTKKATLSGDIPHRIKCAYLFYHELAALTGNSAIIFTVDSQTELVQTFLRYRVSDMSAQTLISSREIFLKLLKAGEIEAAKIELRAHMTRVHTNLW